MTWFGWLYVSLQLFTILATIGLVGKGRRPITPNMALGTTVVSGLLIAGVLLVGTGHL